MGGRCRTPGLCDEVQSPSMPREILFKGVGYDVGSTRIDLRITNQTEYRAWVIDRNGIKRVSSDGKTGRTVPV